MPPERAGDWAQTKKTPRGWKNVFTPLSGLAVWANGAVLALDQWDKLLESGQLWQIAQKEKSLPLQKIGFCHCVLYLHPSNTPPPPQKMWGEMGECFSSKPPKDLSFQALLLLCWGWEGEAGGGDQQVGCAWAYGRRGEATSRQLQTRTLSDVGSQHGSSTKLQLFLRLMMGVIV